MKKRAGLVYLTAEEMATADRMSIESYGVDVVSLMENAGVAVAKLARTLLGGSTQGKSVCCLAGKGNNGGDGLVAVRHLWNWGASVRVVLAGQRSDFRDIPAKQADTLERMGIPILGPDAGFGDSQLLIDALLGYGASGDPREPLAGLIRRANASKKQILAVDIPSGMDATTGNASNPCIAAEATVTFGFPKVGFLNPEAKDVLGELFLADISLPSNVYRAYGSRGGIFKEETLLKIG